jgi:hypothetical protein
METNTTEQAAVAAIVPAIDTMPRFERKATHVQFAINQVKRAIGREGIAKDRNNSRQNYKFRGIDDVYNALNGLLADAELNVLPRMLSRSCEERESKNGGALFNVTVDAEYDFVSAIDGSIYTAKVFGEAMDSADKATNKAMSAAFKYACMQVFCIPTEGDNDADATTHAVKGRTERERPATQTQQRQQRAQPRRNDAPPADAHHQTEGGPWYADHLAAINAAGDGRTLQQAGKVAADAARARKDVPAYNALKAAAEAASVRFNGTQQSAQQQEGQQ